MRLNRATTLIELLVVVAILAILAAIAAVNFHDASVRSKVARVHADMRTIAGALTMYRTDRGAWPPAAIDDLQLLRPLDALTTPVAYLGSVPEDPWGPCGYDFAPEFRVAGYSYKDAVTTSVGMPAETYGDLWREDPRRAWLLHSPGPNRIWDVSPYVDYDPTNGTASLGDISRFSHSEGSTQ